MDINNFLNDLPIKLQKEDKLDRYQFSEYLGNIIFNYLNNVSEENLVMGICGEWGSGKTSVINMALKQTELRFAKKITNENDPIIIFFNPWNFSNQTNLIYQFFTELSINLEKNKLKSIQEIGKKLKVYADKVVPPIAIIGGLVNPAAVPLLGLFVNSFNFIKTNNAEMDLYSIKKDLDNALLKQNHKLIIVIDDIDRLTKSEIQQIFQLVKSLGDFPNTLYILSFDKNIVIKSLEDLNKFSGGNHPKNIGSEYLKKIVPLLIDIPVISSKELRELYMQYVGNFFKQLPDQKMSSRKLIQIYDDFLNLYIRNIRDLKRYMNHISFSFDLFKDDINISDFFVITAIQVFAPEIYNDIWENPDVFIYTSDPMDYFEESKRRQKETFDEIIEKDSKAKSGLSLIFPKLNYMDEKFDILNAPGALPNEFKPTKKIQFEEHFSTYFKFKVPKWELSEIELESIIESLKKFNDFEEIFLKLDSNKKIKFLDNIGMHINKVFDLEGDEKEVSPNDLETIFKFFISKDQLVSSKVLEKMEYVLEKFIESHDKNLDLTEKYINMAKNPSAPCLLVERLIDNENIDNIKLYKLKETCAHKTSEYLKKEGFKDVKYPFFVLRYWKEVGDEKEMQKFMNSLDKQNLLILLSLGSDKQQILENLNEFIDMETLKANIVEITENTESNGLEIEIATKYLNIINEME